MTPEGWEASCARFAPFENVVTGLGLHPWWVNGTEDSRRALEMLETGGFLTRDELPYAKRVLRAAAWTYVVAALSILVQMLRLILIAQRARRR